jgi:chitinase
VKKFFALPLVALMFVGCMMPATPIRTPSPPPVTPPTSPPSSSWVTGYWVGYLADRQPIEAIDWNSLTHVALGIVLPKTDGSLNFDIALDAAGRAKMIKAAHDHARKAIAMIGGENTGPQWLVASSDANRAKLISSLKALTQEGFDGLDLDWEPLADTDQPVFLKLVQELRATLPTAILTFPVDGNDNSNFPANRSFFATVAPYLDQINLMTYGMAGAYQGWKTWHSSPLYHQDSATPTSIDNSVKGYLKANIPAAKLGIGIGFYGLCYGKPATKPLEDTVGIRADGAKLLAGDNVMSYAKIVTDYLPFGTRHWDALARVPYISLAQPTGPKGCTYISYDDEQSILEKGQYAKDHGLGGAIIWNINQGYIPGQTPANPLLDATRKAFLEKR